MWFYFHVVESSFISFKVSPVGVIEGCTGGKFVLHRGTCYGWGSISNTQDSHIVSNYWLISSVEFKARSNGIAKYLMPFLCKLSAQYGRQVIHKIPSLNFRI